MTENRKTPKLRFKGFTDAWEQRKLGEIGKCQSGIGFPDAEQGGKNGTPFYKVSDMNNSGNEQEMTYANNYVTDEQIIRKNWKPIMEVPAVIFAKVGAAIMLNRKRLCRFSFLLDNNTMAYKFGEKWDTNFGKTIFEKIDLTELIQIGALPSYNTTDVENIDIKMPTDMNEQRVLGQYFASLDNLITLHQRKLERLKNVKKSMLDKMFPKDGEVVPEIRFKGFTDAWEQRKLGDVADKVTEKNGGLQYIETFTNSAEYGIISQRDYFDHDIAKIGSLDGYYIVRNEDFVYNPRISTSAPVGPVSRNKMGRTGVMSPLYTVFRPHDVDTTYLEHFFKSKYWHSFMNFNGDSGARSDRFSIKDSVFFEMPIPIPYVEEQRKIGECLTHIDNLITLHQRKLDKLKNIKKSMLDNMFV